MRFCSLKGYKEASDAKFCAYIFKKRNHYDKGGDLLTGTLMMLAENKFKALKPPKTDAKCIIALIAQVQDMSESLATVRGRR